MSSLNFSPPDNYRLTDTTNLVNGVPQVQNRTIPYSNASYQLGNALSALSSQGLSPLNRELERLTNINNGLRGIGYQDDETMGEMAAAAGIGAGGDILSTALKSITSKQINASQLQFAGEKLDFEKEAFGKQFEFNSQAFNKTYQLSRDQFDFQKNMWNQEWQSARDVGLVNPAQFGNISGSMGVQRFSTAALAARTTGRSTYGA